MIRQQYVREAAKGFLLGGVIGITSAFLILSLSGCSAFAGLPDCTDETPFSGPGNYYAQPSDCKISVEKTSFDFTYVWLPDNPSVGDEFTIKENTSSQECELYEEQEYCWPAGVGVQSVNSETLIDDVQGVILSDFHQYIRVRFDGTNWVTLELGYF